MSVVTTPPALQQNKQASPKCVTCNKPKKTNPQQAVNNKNGPQSKPHFNPKISKVELVRGAVKTNMKKVTEDLVKIIKNLQTQLHRISKDKKPEETDLIEPKEKQFFKNTSNKKNVQSPSKTSNNNNNKNNNLKQNSFNKSNASTNSVTSNSAPRTGPVVPNKVASIRSNNAPSTIKNTSKDQKNLQNPSKTSNNNNNNSKGNSFNKLNTSINAVTSNSPSRTGSIVSNKVASIRSNAPSTNRSSTGSLTASNKVFLKQLNTPNADPLKLLKDEVQRAMRLRKTFTVRGNFVSIRKALHQRGWVEKLHISYKDQLNSEIRKFQMYSIQELIALAKNQTITTICKAMITSKLLGSHQVDFYWGTSNESFKDNPDKIKFTMINKLKRDIASYTNKQGLCEASAVAHWHNIPGVAKLNHPRSYSLAKNGDTKGFVDDFNLTAAISILKWVVKNSQSGECKIISSSGRIPLEVFEFAANECCKLIKIHKHKDIDKPVVEASEEEWTKFLDYYYKTIHFSNHFRKESAIIDEDCLVRRANFILNNIKEYCPYLDMDGMMNIWILKPAVGCRGQGIHICRTLQYVLKTIKQNNNIRYIIQKYIERPLLIYNTKFDIRQWFLISNSCPLTIWMYKQSYLRFSSQTYNLRKLHESIHLTNNAVQSRYKNATLDTALPSYHMWDSNEFQTYLSNIGYPNVFKHVIYPGMRKNICAAILMHQHKMIYRKNSFELYGADFILTEDFQPWLLEINSSPALAPSTPITAKMCPKVLEDLIKVMIDFANNTKANTGGFELVYKEQITKLPKAEDLQVFGHPLKDDYFYNPPEEKKPAPQVSEKQQKVLTQKGDCLQDYGNEIKNTLRNILGIIQEVKIKHDVKNMACGSFAITNNETIHT